MKKPPASQPCPPAPRDPLEAARFLRPQLPPPPIVIPRRRPRAQPFAGLVAWPLLGGRVIRARHGAS